MLAGASLRSVSAKTPFSVASASRHMTNHVRGPIQLHDDEPVVGTAVHDFAARLLDIANDARRLRAHATANSNPTMLLRALAAERDALTQLMTGLGIDSPAAIEILSDAGILRRAVVELIEQRPELAEVVATAYDDAGQRDVGDTLRQMGSNSARRLQVVPSDDQGGPR